MGIPAERRTAYQASAAPIDYQGDMESLNDIKRVHEGIVSPAAVKRGSHKKSAVLMRHTKNKEPCRSSIDDFQKHDRKRQNPWPIRTYACSSHIPGLFYLSCIR